MLHNLPIILNRYCIIENERFFILNLHDRRFLIRDKCPHRGGPLSLGQLCEKSESLRCPWHDGVFRCSALTKKALAAVRIHQELFVTC
jgi:nitrite reductase/ring-hydroxylating ferredoxin subunit